jgi:ribosomal protein L33
MCMEAHLYQHSLCHLERLCRQLWGHTYITELNARGSWRQLQAEKGDTRRKERRHWNRRRDGIEKWRRQRKQRVGLSSQRQRRHNTKTWNKGRKKEGWKIKKISEKCRKKTCFGLFAPNTADIWTEYSWFCKIWDFHSSYYDSYSLLGCSIV